MGFDFAGFRRSLANDDFAWQQHALQRLDERNLRQGQVVKALMASEVIEDYPQDYPFPSALVLGWIGRKPVHAVVAYDSERGFGYIVTVYFPDAENFLPDYRTRRQDHAPED
jgi:hypothetical protein